MAMNAGEARVREGLAKALITGLVLCLALGALAGWLRWWEGLFVLFQGAGCGLLLAWLIGKLAGSGGGGPRHPGFGPALALALAWWVAFMAGQLAGLGLAQAWFDPLGWLLRVWDGKSTEFVFGVAATGSVHRGFAMGVSGWFWLVLNLIDWLIMVVFLLAMPWSSGGKRAAASAAAGGAS